MFQIQAGKTAKQTLEENWDTAETLLALLKACIVETGGMIPQKFFEFFPQVFPQGCIELAIVKMDPDTRTPHVFMFRRPEDDPHWPGQLHMPGTTLYALDDEDKMWGRLLREELGDAFAKEDFILTLIHISTLEERERGACMHSVYICWCASDTTIASGDFYSIHNPPTETIRHHADILKKLKGIHDATTPAP